MIFDEVRLWIDPVKRSGPEAMAVDEWLLETADMPVLRVYQWLGDWGSVGYFGSLAEAKSAFPGIEWVRRWTGGGTVDHRSDWTYTVVAPAGEPLTGLRGAESYRILHAALEDALQADGIYARMCTGDGETGAALCFENPVSHDLIGDGGRKLAGAGQRRTHWGLLHQGSVAVACDSAASRIRAERLASCLAEKRTECEWFPPADVIALKVKQRYALSTWTERR